MRSSAVESGEARPARRCLIISGGEFDPAAAHEAGDYVIACDRGYVHAQALGITPDLFVGDFDSFAGELDGAVSVLRLPCVKDDTDTMAAVKAALERGFRRIALCCALGGRADHTIANYQSALYAARRGAEVSILASDTRVRFLHEGTIVLGRAEGWSLSLFSAGDRCEGVSISGAKYEMADGLLTGDFPLGVSNEWREDTVTVRVRKGTLMIVESRF